MDRRTLLALLLMAAVIVLTPRLFPGHAPTTVATPADSAALNAPNAQTATNTPSPAASPVARNAEAQIGDTTRAASHDHVDTSTVEGNDARFKFSSRGAALESVTLKSYKALQPGGGLLEIRAPSGPLLRVLAVSGPDTIPFDRANFGTPTKTGNELTYVGAVGADSLQLAYTVVPDSFVIHVKGKVSGARSSARNEFVLLDFPATFKSYEADSVDDQRHLAFAYMPLKGDAQGLPVAKLDPGEKRIAPGPHAWAAFKNKYFIVGLLALPQDSSFAEFSATGLPRSSRIATNAQGSAVVRTTNGQFALDMYTGPQQWNRLHALGRGFENSNPYGGLLQPIIQPFARIVLRILLWMHARLALSYGWVLVIFGVVVRTVLWPLNQTAMRSSVKMQRIQPEITELQKRYKSDPQKLQTEMMRVYKDHDMSPLSMFSGCLPMLLPMPVLFALFYVFQNTIEFRGVPFLWLHDISQKDPYYLLPIIMGASMFVLSWIGTRNTPPNPQTKMMGYIFPVMMTVLLANLAAGLNLYYAIQNLAALPQQWIIANERARSGNKSSGSGNSGPPGELESRTKANARMVPAKK